MAGELIYSSGCGLIGMWGGTCLTKDTSGLHCIFLPLISLLFGFCAWLIEVCTDGKLPGLGEKDVFFYCMYFCIKLYKFILHVSINFSCFLQHCHYITIMNILFVVIQLEFVNLLLLNQLFLYLLRFRVFCAVTRTHRLPYQFFEKQEPLRVAYVIKSSTKGGTENCHSALISSSRPIQAASSQRNCQVKHLPFQSLSATNSYSLRITKLLPLFVPSPLNLYSILPSSLQDLSCGMFSYSLDIIHFCCLIFSFQFGCIFSSLTEFYHYSSDLALFDEMVLLSYYIQESWSVCFYCIQLQKKLSYLTSYGFFTRLREHNRAFWELGNEIFLIPLKALSKSAN
ncbi:hypothetical protein VP01_2528g3 [Puccinia sorghi]|uniref:Uncharacterized protein n=1 Tax=Puccinia sorghi TaxID=27349 RepID=A0A0L6V790_9BASI|nr:hypothetical protein VP01_2528g3 [Puccinia sorghi]